MRVALVLAKMFENTRDFIQTVARSEGCTVSLVKGNEDTLEALRVLRFADRIWFEGPGPLFHQLLDRPTSRWITGAVLRADEQDAKTLPFPETWRMVSDLIVPSHETGDVVHRSPGPASGKACIHILPTDKRTQLLGRAGPMKDMNQLGRILGISGNDLPLNTWEWASPLGDICGRGVVILGKPLEPFLDFLRVSHGSEVFRSFQNLREGEADTIIFWASLSRETASRELREALKHLKDDGTVGVVCPPEPTPTDLSTEAALRGVSDPNLWKCEVELTRVGPAVLVTPTGCDERLPRENLPRVEVTGEWPLVSAAMPVYNDEERVGRAILSLLKQTYPNIEIVVADDGSTDRTREAVEKYLDDQRVRYFYKPHTGRPETRNLCVEKSRGAYLAWLDSDDEALPNRIAAQMEAVRDDPTIDILHSDGLIFRPDGTLRQVRRYKPFCSSNLPGLLLQGFSTICPILNTSATIRRSLYDRIGLYDSEFYRCQDYDFYVRCAIARDVRFGHLPAPLVRAYLSAPRADTRQRGFEFYYKLALKLINSFTPEELLDDKARDLQEDPSLALARKLLDMLVLYGSPSGHPLFAEIEARVQAVLRSDSAFDRAGAMCLMGAIAHYSRDKAAAREHYENALHLVPEFHEAVEHMRILGLQIARTEEPSNELQPL